MAELLHMSQSQYQRREKGEIKISDFDWQRISKVLDLPVENLIESNLININMVDFKVESLNFDNLHLALSDINIQHIESQKQYTEIREKNTRHKHENLFLKSKNK